MVRVKRQRLDQLLVERGLAPGRAQARALIMAREVSVNGEVATGAAAPVQHDVELSLRTPPRYVGRGGLKLEHALERCAFEGRGVAVRGAHCLDVGASVGGFTDCLLQHGAAHVTAVDVGYGQLALRLRDDPRVEVRERTNARALAPLEPPVALATVDVSFISLTTVLPAVVRSVREGGDLLVLVKPQFEAERAEVEPGGVIRSPLLGPAGNREFFLWLRRSS